MNTIKAQAFFTLPAVYASLQAYDARSAAKWVETNKVALQSFVGNLVALKECYTLEQAKKVYQAFAALPEKVQKGLLNTRRYNGNTYVTLGQFAEPKANKGVFNLTKSSTKECFLLFANAENACITPKPEKGTSKVDKAQAKEALIGSTPAFESSFSPRELTQAEKNLKAVKTAFTRLSNLAGQANQSELLIRIEALAADLTEVFAQMVTDDAAAGLPAAGLPEVTEDEKQAKTA